MNAPGEERMTAREEVRIAAGQLRQVLPFLLSFPRPQSPSHHLRCVRHGIAYLVVRLGSGGAY